MVFCGFLLAIAAGHTEFTENPTCDRIVSLDVVKLETVLATLYNNQRFDELQGLYSPTARVVPPGSNMTILQPDISSFFSTAYMSGMQNLSTVPWCTFRTVLEDKVELVHEIGEGSLAGQTFRYYTQWKVLNASSMVIEVDIMALNTSAPLAESFQKLVLPFWRSNVRRNTFGNCSDIVRRQEAFCNQLFGTQNWMLLAGFYHPSAVMVPPSGRGFMPQGSLEDYFGVLYNDGMTHAAWNATVVDSLGPLGPIHVIGTFSTALGDMTYFSTFRFNGVSWKLSFQALSIGE